MSDTPIADLSTIERHRPANTTTEPRNVRALTIVAHPDPGRVGAQLLLRALENGGDVALSRNAPMFVHPGRQLGASLGDPFISRKNLYLAPADRGGVRVHVAEHSTDVVIGEPVQGRIEIAAEAVARGVAIALAERVVLLLHRTTEHGLLGRAPDRVGLGGGLGGGFGHGLGHGLGMLGCSAAIHRVRQTIERISDLDLPVLIRGETGTGKELVARAIHEHGPRRAGPFVSINLATIAGDLAAAELFGARKGAYTGATSDRPGLFAAAQHGTLFLDELGEASPELQAMLLRVLETGEIHPVGGRSAVAVNARVITATDANLEQRIREGSFKEPLLHRLAAYRIHVPPLRERAEDIGVLFHHFAREQLERMGQAYRLEPREPRADAWLPASLAMRLVSHSWPGNVRELKNVARQLVIESRERDSLRLDGEFARQFDESGAQVVVDPRTVRTVRTVQSGPPGLGPGSPGTAPPARERRKPAQVSEHEMRAALRASGWECKAAADRLGIARSSIYDLLARFPSIRTVADLSDDEVRRCHQACAGDIAAMAERLEVSPRALKRRVKELGLG